MLMIMTLATLPAPPTRPAPTIDQRVTFRAAACPCLAQTPATITAVVPLADGGWLVALEYDAPVRWHGKLVRHLDARWDDVEVCP